MLQEIVMTKQGEDVEFLPDGVQDAQDVIEVPYPVLDKALKCGIIKPVELPGRTPLGVLDYNTWYALVDVVERAYEGVYVQ